MRRLINDEWIFREFPGETSYEKVRDELDNNGSSFGLIDIPHDWMIYDTNDLYRSSVGVYVRQLKLDAAKHNAVYFEGVYMRTTAYLNGEQIFFWPYGYTSFEVDLTPYQKDGDNELLVYVDYRYPNTRWYSGAGIFRDVFLISTEHTRLVTDGIYFNAVARDSGTNDFMVTVDTEAVGGNPETSSVIRHTIIDDAGREITVSSSPVKLYKDPVTNTQSFEVNAAIRWDIDNPYLYTLKTELYVDTSVVNAVENRDVETDETKPKIDFCVKEDGEKNTELSIILGDKKLGEENGTYKLIDSYTQKVGFREISFSPDQGFFLNGRHIKIHGACQHHDLGALGAAFNKKAARRQIEKLKSIGVNSIRTSHNPPATGLMEIADEMGILIDSEAFDMWEQSKTENDYGLFFHEWCEKDVKSWVKRDRNHPCLIMWSCGNEIPDTNNLEAVDIAKRLVETVRRYDHRHNAYTTIGSNFVAWENAQKSQDVFEVSGYNYLESVYDEHHERFPHWCIYGSETASTVQSRGIYHFPKSNRMLTYEDMQCSCLDNCSTNWGAKSVHRFITYDRDRDFCAGQYIWTGWDYIGEPTPYFSKNSFFGHIDTAGFFKDTAYIIKAGWVPESEDPFVHIAPYWDFNDGQIIDVDVYSNAHKIALYYNDELVGEKSLDQAHDKIYSASFVVPYKEGVLAAFAYDAAGNEIARCEERSFGNPAKIELKTEYEEIRADGEDLQFIEITVLDKDGNEVKNARNRVSINVSGPARLVGMDNGDSTDYDQYKTNSRKLFSGKLMAIIAATKTPGSICVTASSEGLPDKSITFEAVEAKGREGIACGYDVLDDKTECVESGSVVLRVQNENGSDGIEEYAEKKGTQRDNNEKDSCCNSETNGKGNFSKDGQNLANEVPVRKIVLTCDNESRKLDPDVKEIKLSAKIEPENATYRDIKYKAVNSDGIESPAVEIELTEDGAVLYAKHDGDFRLVASASNGKDHPEILSELDFSVSGFGEAYLDPYYFVYGCQFDESSKPADLSFRGSVKLEDDSTISFDRVDFGEYGSDTLRLSLFSFRDEESVEIWEGDAYSGELIYSGKYEVPTEYNVLQEDTFKLTKRVNGVKRISFKLEHGIVFGGFAMDRQSKAYGRLRANEYSMITGDSFVEQNDGIYSIGNNVDIEFSDMDFTDGVSKITITGRANKTENPVHIRFFKGDEVIKQMVEFPVSDKIESRTFDIEGFTGSGKIDFIFLPGSDFDFIDFQFL